MNRSKHDQPQRKDVELDNYAPDISNKKNNLANYFFNTAVITTIFALIADTLLTLVREFITFFNAATNSSYKLATIIPQELYYTLGIISLAISPILILYELKEMYENYKNKNSKRKHALSIIKIFLLTCTTLIAIQEISALSLPTIFASSIPIAGVAFLTLTLLYQVAKTGYTTTSKTKKAFCLIVGACLLAVATLAIIGSLTTGAAIGILIGAAIYNIMLRFLRLPKFFSMLNKNTQQTNINNDSLKNDSPTQDKSQIAEHTSKTENEVAQLHEQVSSLQHTKAIQQVTLDNSKREINELKQELNELKQELNELKQELNELKQELDALMQETKDPANTEKQEPPSTPTNTM
jgi:regulator of replication initiation timing